MNNHELSIRLMQSSDLDEVIRIHISQFSGSRSTHLGKPFLRRMYSWFINHHPKLALVADYRNSVIGFVVGSIGGYGRNIFRYALPQIIFGILTHPSMILRKETFALWHSFVKGLLPRQSEPSKLSQPDQRPMQSNAALSSIAIDSHYQGKGFGKALMQLFELNARQLGAQTTSLTVEKDNQAAINLYISCGWKIDKKNQQSVHFVKSLNPQLNLSDA